MSAFGEVVQALIGSETGLANELDGSSPAPIPSVGSRPGRIADARSWTAPDASGHGQVAVHRDALRGVAAGMRLDLQDLEGAVSRLNGVRHGGGVSITANTGLIAGWPTAVGFNGNASAAFSGIVLASQQTGTTHLDTSGRLTSSAAAYDQSESDNLRAARSVGTSLSSVTGLVASYGTGGRPASSALGAQPSYPVRIHAVPGFSGAGMSAGTIMEILHGLSPDEVTAAGGAHTRLGTMLDTVAGRLAANAHKLAQNWSGSAAQAAMGQFQQLHSRMVMLAQQALQVGSVLSWLGDEVLPKFASLPDPRVSTTSLVLGDAETSAALGGPVGAVIGAGVGLIDELDGSAQAAADRTAQQYIAKLSSYLVIADQSLPDSIGAPAAPAKGSGKGSGPTVPVTVGASGGGSGAGARLADGGSSTSRATGGAGAASRQAGAAAPPSSLQGTTIPGGPISSPAGSAPAPASASPPPGSGGLSGGLPGPVPTVPGTTEPTPGTVTGTLDDNTGPTVGQVSAGSPGSVAPEASGLVSDEPGALPGLPGTNGISGSDSFVAGDVAGAQSLQLDTDGTLAGAEEGSLAPDLAGFPMMGTGGAAQPEEQERIRQAWLNGDDLWRLPVNLVPQVIDDDK